MTSIRFTPIAIALVAAASSTFTQQAQALPQVSREQAMVMFTGMTAGMLCSVDSGIISEKLAEVTLQETTKQHGIEWLYEETRSWTEEQNRRFFKRVENLTEMVGGCQGLFRMSAAYLEQMGE